MGLSVYMELEYIGRNWFTELKYMGSNSASQVGLLACMEMECIGIHCQMGWSVHMELEFIESFR